VAFTHVDHQAIGDQRRQGTRTLGGVRPMLLKLAMGDWLVGGPERGEQRPAALPVGTFIASVAPTRIGG
jgi:hypothetical protein